MAGTVDRLLDEVRDGDSQAGIEIYQRYAERIRHLAADKLDRRLSGKVGAEDIVQSVFRSFFRRNNELQFSFENWNSLWGLLATIASRKCDRKGQEFTYAKRDFRRESKMSLERLSARQPSGELTAECLVDIQDAVEWSMTGLTSLQRQIVLLRLANFSTTEIGKRVGRTERTARRVVDKFRMRLENQL